MVLESVIGLLGIILAVWIIYDVLVKQKQMTNGIKAVWIIFAILFSIITAIVYYFVVKRK